MQKLFITCVSFKNFNLQLRMALAAHYALDSQKSGMEIRMALVHKNIHWLDGQKETTLLNVNKSLFSQKITCELSRLTLEIKPVYKS
jgi:hypothetical protein